MSYQVIARKWRPQSFEEVTGQEAITRTLRNAVEHERLHHAYLFSGARGVGKTTTARLLAKALNCHKSERPTPTPCAADDPSACASCREVAEGRSIDVLEIDAASNTGVDNVREAIINTVAVRPARDRFKVFIIDEVHMLSGAAFNALLKTLEEPPPRIVFIMATTESHKIPDTILSRSQQFEFRTIPTAKIFDRLRRIADAEKIDVSDEALREIARAGEGSMRDAQSAFDQVISFSAGAIGVEEVGTALGLAGAEMRSRVVRAVAEEGAAEALAVVDDLVMRGHDLRNFCRDMMAHVRDLLLVKVGGGAAELLDAGEAERREMSREAASFSESDLVRFFHSLTETEKLLRESAHPRYQLEIGLVKLIEMRRLAPVGQILERLRALEEALRAGTGMAVGSGSAPASSTPPAAAGGTTPRRGATGGGRHAAGEPGVDDNSASPDGDDKPAERGEVSAGVGAHAPEADVPPFEPAPPRATTTAPPPASSQAATAVSRAPKIPSLPSLPTKQVAAAPPATPAGLRLVPSSSPKANEAEQTGPPPSFFEEPPPEADPLGWNTPHRTKTNAAPAASPSTQRAASAPSNPTPSNVSAAAARAVSSAQTFDASSGAQGTLEQIKRALEDKRKPFLVTALEGARKVQLDEDELFVEYAPEGKHLRDALAKPDNVKVLREACREAAGRAVGVRIVVCEAGEVGDEQRTQQDEERRERQRLRELAEQNPAVQHMLRTFRAEIIDVRRVEPGGEQTGQKQT